MSGLLTEPTEARAIDSNTTVDVPDWLRREGDRLEALHHRKHFRVVNKSSTAHHDAARSRP